MLNFKNAGACLKRGCPPASGNAARTKCELLAITPDTGLFADLQYAAARRGWTVRWARSVTAAIAFLASRPTPVILYDWYSASEDWTASIDRLTMLPGNPCIILAADRVNERLWRRALDRNVYDVVCRSGQFEHLLATLRFASNWKARFSDLALVERMRQ
jgi:DNA-binding NtrC family response regulator